MASLETSGKSQKKPDLSNLFRVPGSSEEGETTDSTDEESEGVAALPSRPAHKTREVPLVKWNLKFTGYAKGMTVHTFLERVAELCRARNVSEGELFEQALDSFEGRGLMWYRSNRNRINSWKELTALLVRRYEPPNYPSAFMSRNFVSNTASV